MNCPRTYSCGYVGQLENFFNPARMSSSSRISKVSYSMSLFPRSSTICRLNPHCGDALLPFINRRMSLDDSRALIRSSIGTAPSASLSSPFSLSSFITSSPPANFPFAYTCGYVGQFEYVFISARSPSSARISTPENSIPSSAKIPTNSLLNLHLGSSRSPFINTTTGALSTSPPIYLFTASSFGRLAVLANPSATSFNLPGSAPTTLAATTSLLPSVGAGCANTNVGACVTANRRATSGAFPASIWRKESGGVEGGGEVARARKTDSMWVAMGSAWVKRTMEGPRSMAEWRESKVV
mmetsp:Transcript_24229/g.60341  ORF Transcript_24229/g.60341 Transcript_24229/m.60341 type:complete len:297 (+) Transcript_24229:263-1153(+)